ncbi:ubiquinol-cytochrome c reductase iron-sulfur subunit [Thalassospira marina]|uniref:Ubiquinol-cytochrome c reductase iron-sulfur subunit n=1 Tax=Thalassospira marina TaxID=2048283 RepID=A0A2N3KX32_9PROT|nr:ubiquinol-cytochrome c reductase iron-sulfur subunit [Thalassospira marina]AUG53991.1 ubiquinol-cytochrome c reductase iron-sulfur subunit [Thalassospira marina]PKR55124.1 ubiquinol-cytochrome c reductase iron-sulfur subunit [Thalassospira marina]
MSQTVQSSGENPDENRRDFLTLATTAVGVVGTGMALWPFVDSMNPSKDVLALASVEVNLSNIPVGQAIKVMWRGKPVFIRHRTEREIKEAEDVALNQLVDPETDDARVQKKEWLIVVGVCTHLGCIPMGTATGEPRGDFDGWYCPCHGSHYDSSGRIRKGPAPKNLHVPTYTFLTDTSVKIG